MHDCCDNCGQDYEFTAEKDRMVIYLVEDQRFNHVLAHCPHCDGDTRIYVEPEVLLVVMREHQLPILLFDAVHDFVLEMREALESGDNEGPYGKRPSTDTSGLPDIPPVMRRELHDTLREFGGPCTDGCGHTPPPPREYEG